MVNSYIYQTILVILISQNATLSIHLLIYLYFLSICIVYICISYLSIYISLSIYLSICLFICLSICLSVYLSIFLSIYLSIYLSTYLFYVPFCSNFNYINYICMKGKLINQTLIQS